MDRSNRRQAIQEGRFLSLASDITLHPAADCLTPKERPYVIPEYDPEGSTARSRLSHQMASMLSQNRRPAPSQEGPVRKTTATEPKKIDTSQNRSLPPAIHTFGAKLGLGHLQKSIASPTHMAPPARSSRLSTFHQTFGMRSSRLSITPSMLPPDHASTYPGQGRSAHMHTIISEEPTAKPFMHMIELPEEPISNQPPDGGTLAWMQVFAGFLVVMDAQ